MARFPKQIPRSNEPVDAIRAGCLAEAEAALEAFTSGAFI